MDKLVLNIPRLQDAVKYSRDASDKIGNIRESVVGSNQKLTANGVWTGSAASAYKSVGVGWTGNFNAHGITAGKMHSALKTVYDKAVKLNRQALDFAGKVGGSSGAGFKNVLTYDPNVGVLEACDKAAAQFEAQLSRLNAISYALPETRGTRSCVVAQTSVSVP